MLWILKWNTQSAVSFDACSTHQTCHTDRRTSKSITGANLTKIMILLLCVALCSYFSNTLTSMVNDSVTKTSSKDNVGAFNGTSLSLSL